MTEMARQPPRRFMHLNEKHVHRPFCAIGVAEETTCSSGSQGPISYQGHKSSLNQPQVGAHTTLTTVIELSFPTK